MKHIARAFIIAAMLTSAPSSGWADWREFVPRFFLSGAELGVNAIYESDSSNAGAEIKTRSIFLRETLTLSTTAFIYDPRFIDLGLSVSGGFKQENFTTSTAPSPGWRTATAKEYNFSMYVLPKHPYNLYLYGYRTEPLVVSELGVQPPSVETGKGAVFRYKKKPYFFNIKYNTTTLETESGPATVNMFNTSGTYFKEFSKGSKMFFTGEYEHRNFSSPAAPAGTSNDYSFSNYIGYRPVDLTSSVAKNTFDQETSTGRLKNDGFSWTESLAASLPLNFDAGLSYQYQKNTSTVEESTSPFSELSSTGKGIGFTLTHRLYESLRSSYGLRFDSTTSPSGDTSETTHSLTFNYTKNIPWGRLLTGADFEKSTIENSGETMIVNEPHVATPVPGSFTLGQQEADSSTIKLFVKSPLPPSEFISLQENVHYIVTPLGNTFQITIINLPSQFILPGVFDFFVSYSVQAANFKLRMDNFSYNFSLDLFNGLLNPYYIYSTTTSSMVSGALPEGTAAVESHAHAAGLIFHKAPYRALIEYQRVTSNVSSSSTWRGEVNYNKYITENTQINATASYTLRNYPRGTSIQSGQGFTEKIATLSAHVLKQILEKSLTFSAGGTYSYISGMTKSTAYSLDSNLSWFIGKLTLSLGATVSRSDSEGTSLLSGEARQLHASRFHQYYYLNFKRNLF
jgi:hypothetical protein